MAGEQILVVEDQRAVAGALQMRLRGLGYAVTGVAKDGPEAIEKASELNPDLILMDIKLGEGMDGIEAAQHIRANMDVPVVYVSAYVDQKLLERARQTNPAGFINKPFTTKDLLTAIDLALFQHAEALLATHSPQAQPVEEEDDQKDALITIDVEGRINFVTRAAERLLAWRRKQMIGRSLIDALSDIYGLTTEVATTTVKGVLTSGNEEQLVRQSSARGSDAVDLLTPLFDVQGECMGAALKFSTAQSMVTSSAQSRAFAKALDAIPVGIVIVSEEMRVCHMNAYADEILRHNSSLDCTANRLLARDRQFDEKLKQLVQVAMMKSREGIADSSEAIFVSSPAQREQIEIIVTPAEHAGFGSPDEALVVLYLFDASLERHISRDVLNRLYGLTQTEAKLVQHLVSGSTLDKAAKQLEISVNTARTHLKHVFHKTGINRQAELVHRVETGPAGLLVNFNGRH